MEFSCTNYKKILIFSQKKAVFIFPQMKPALFTRRKISYISGEENPEKTSHIFSKERFSYISETETLKNFLSSLYFRLQLAKPENEKFLIFFLIKEQNFLKYFLIVLIKHFFSFYNIFLYLTSFCFSSSERFL